jgi:uncharacterized protein
MIGDLNVGDFSAAAGSKNAGQQQLQVGGFKVDLPIFLINGNTEGRTLAITAGMHGCEYAGIAAALQLGHRLQPARLCGRIILLPLVNVPAFYQRIPYVCPLDGRNISRLFPGKADGSASEQIAFWLWENVIRRVDYFVDLHGGDLCEALTPYVNCHHSDSSPVNDKCLELAKAYGLPFVKKTSRKTTAYGFAAEAGIPSFLAEAGGQGTCSPEAVALHADGLDRLLRHLGMIDGPPCEPRPVQLLSRSVGLRCEHDGFYYPKVAVGERVREGQDLGAVLDFRGNVLQSLIAPTDGVVLVLISSLAVSNGGPLLSIAA